MHSSLPAPRAATAPDGIDPGSAETPAPAPAAPVEIGGCPGPDPTRYGDWEKGGRCIDF
jgi:hypothetical protein